MPGRRITLRRLAIAVLCVVSLAVCLGLAWWQWQRYESVSGTWQNLGYVLQWPLFGLFPAFLVWRMRRLRALHAQQPAPAPAPSPAPEPRRPVRQDDDDPVLAEYNRYLAELNAADQEHSR
jgi:DNA-binding transcriptional regulator of glucitol operon